MEILNDLVAIIITIFMGYFAWISSVIVSEENMIKRGDKNILLKQRIDVLEKELKDAEKEVNSIKQELFLTIAELKQTEGEKNGC